MRAPIVVGIDVATLTFMVPSAGKRTGEAVPSTWIVYRRYRDFYDFQVCRSLAFAGRGLVVDSSAVNWGPQSNMKKAGFNVGPPFPGKKAFGRFGDEFLVTRHRMLNAWLRALIECPVTCDAGIRCTCL